MKKVLMWGGVIILVLVALNYLGIFRVNLPTSSQGTNLVIGGGAVVASRIL